jgi:hypothetical protein
MSKQHKEKTMVVRPRKNVKKTAMNTSKEGSKSSTSPSLKSMKRSDIDRVPTINVQPIQRVQRMYQASGSVNGQFTIQSGIIQFLVATSANLVQPVIEMFRIRRVRAWANLASSGNAGFVEITPLAQDTTSNCFNSPPMSYVDTTNSSTQTAHVDYKTDVNQPSGSWHNTSTTNVGLALFQFASSANASWVIDYDIIYGWSEAVNNFSQSIPGTGTTGTLCARIPVTNLSPLGVNTY